jgi:FtsP/CotA-like multicopper oxidase with cupredoxin domain
MPQDFLPATKVKELEESGESAMKASLAKNMPHGYEVGYRYFTINGRMLGHGEPLRVKQGERVLFHILNGSATEIRSLALPGHSFKVIALDGNPVPHPAEVPVLWLGTAERVSAVVEMNHPGVWTMGDLADDDRSHGMGIVVEYSGQKGLDASPAISLGLHPLRESFGKSGRARRNHPHDLRKAERGRARV